MKPLLDFSLLDGKCKKTPVYALESSGGMKVTPTVKESKLPPLKASESVLESKVSISQGIRAGKNPYPLLLDAVELISILTGEQNFYIMHRDIIQGMGVLDEPPAEWTKSSSESSLKTLEANRQNIDKAITAHKQFLAGQPIEETTAENEYDSHVKKCFKEAYDFFTKHKKAFTGEDWEKIIKDISLYSINSFISDLIVACFNELERNYHRRNEKPEKGADNI